MGTFAKITDLFQEGQVLVLSKGDQQIPLWIAKLTPFEVEEARQDGRVARARLILALKDVGSPDYALFMSGYDEQSDDAVINNLLENRETEWLAAAVRDLRQDPEWKERAELLEFGGSELTDKPDDDPEVVVMNRIAVQYGERLNEIVEEKREEERVLLAGADRELLKEKYREAYLDARGLTSFTVAYQAAEVFFATRECKGKPVDGVWLHELCGSHSTRLMDTKQQAAALPTAVWSQIREAIQQLNMPSDVARFSAAPESSSASSEQPSVPAEESTPSTPEVTPAEPTGT